MARATVERVVGHGRYFAYVGTDCEDTVGAYATAEPPVERTSLCKARGLTTSAMHYGDDVLDIEFDFLNHELRMRLGSGHFRSPMLRQFAI